MGDRAYRAMWVAVAASIAAGCQTNAAGTTLAFSQTPPTVQAAYQQYYRDAVIRTITRQTRDGQDYYMFRYRSAEGADHDVEFNGAGNEVDKH